MRRITKTILRYFMGTALVLISVIAVGIGLLTATGPGQTLLASMISSVSSSSEQQMEITGISGIWSGDLAIETMSISDAQGSWLQVNDVRIQWRPLAVLRAHFEASSINIDSVELTRIPESDNQTSTEGGSSIPLTLNVHRFRLGNLKLSESVAGRQFNLQADGAASLDVSPLDVQAKMRIESLDHGSEILNLDLAYTPESDRADINLTAREPPNGIVANLLQFEGGSAFDLQLVGSGPLANWQMQLLGTMNDERVLEAAGNVVATEEVQHLLVTGTAEAGKLLPPRYRPLVGDVLDIDFDIARASSGKIDIRKAKINAEQFFLTAKGIFDPDGANAITGGFSSRDAALNITDGLVAGLPNFAPHSFTFSVTGSGEQAKVEATADIPLIDAGSVQLVGLKSHVVAPKFNLENLEGAFKAQTSVAKVMSANDDVQRLAGGEQFLEAAGELTKERLHIGSINISNPGLNIDGSAQYLLSDQEWEAAFNSILERQAMPPVAARLVREPLKLEISASGETRGGIRGTLHSIKGGPLSANGSARVNQGEVEANVKMALGSIKGLVEGLDAVVGADLSVSGGLDNPLVDMRITGDDLVYNDHTASDFELSVKGTANVLEPDIQVTLSGELDAQPVKGSARLYFRDGQRVLENLRFVNGANSVAGALMFDDRFVPTGAIELDLPDLKTLGALALQEIDGAAQGNIRFSKSTGVPVMDFEIVSDKIKRSDLSIAGATFGLSAIDYLLKPKLSGKVRVDSLLAGGAFVSGIELDLSQDGQWTQFAVATTANKIPVKASGRVLAGSDIIVELADARAVVENIPVTLTKPAKTKVTGGTAIIEQLELGLAKGRASISGSAGNHLNLDVNITAIDAAIANQFVPDLGASGSVSGRANITGQASLPKVVFDAKLANGNVKQSRELGVAGLDVVSSGRFDGVTLALKTRMTNAQGLALQGGGTIGLKGVQQLDLAFDGKVPFPLLARQLSAQGIILEGSSNVSVQVTGSTHKPRINGRITSEGGRFVHAESGIAINTLALEMALADQQVQIRRLTGKLSTGGSVEANGTIGIAPDSSYPANIKVKVLDGVYTDHNSVASKFDANLALEGPLVADPIASGTISLKRTTVTVPERIPSSISSLDVKHKNANSDISRQAEGLKPAKTQSKSGMRLAVDIRATNQIFVRGRGLDAELGGNLKLTNSISNPQAQGAFQIRRGRMSILGKRLDFKRGQMNFEGSLVPELDITAETERDQYIIAINVVGAADNPQFKFSSSPVLAEDEVLAMLVFGKELGSLSALQIVKLGQAVATLTGHGGNSSLLDKFQKLIKVDDLDVKTDSETGETTVGVGRYINDKTYVGVERGSGAGTGKATIDLTIGKGVKLRGEAGEDGQNKAGIFYEREY